MSVNAGRARIATPRAPGARRTAGGTPALALGALCLAAAASVSAQPPAGGALDPREPLLDDERAAAAEPAPELAFDVPETTLPDNDLVRIGAIEISEIRVEGSSVFAPAELDAFTAPYEQRTVSLEELHALRHALSRAYAERGYVNSGVVIPDQRVENGTVTLRAVEGALTEIDVRGNRRLREGPIRRRIARYVDDPLDIAALQAGLRVLQEEPLVERVNAQLLPGSALGEGHLRLGITEQPPFEVAVTAANDRSPSVGEDRGTLALGFRGLVGNGDALTGRFGLTEGVEDNVLGYEVPVTSGGATLEVLLAEQQADIVEEPFDDIDIKSELDSWSVTASVPFVRAAGRSVRGIFGFEHKRSESTLLGVPFSFSPGDVDGRAEGSAVSLGAEWTRQRARQAWAVRGTFQVGVDALDATINETGPETVPDTEFVTFLGQFQYLRRIDWRDSRLLVRTVVQEARDPLLAMYKLPVGGRYSVRGYRENQFVRDNGASASVEYRFPPLVDEAGRGRGNLNLAVFADYGVSWDENDELVTSRRERIASVGLGLLWDPLPALHAELYYGADLDDQGNPDEALQEKGFHYALSFQRRF